MEEKGGDFLWEKNGKISDLEDVGKKETRFDREEEDCCL
jgi:hypothetical protein